jgi:hypothetical protein
MMAVSRILSEISSVTLPAFQIDGFGCIRNHLAGFGSNSAISNLLNDKHFLVISLRSQNFLIFLGVLCGLGENLLP